MDIDKPLDEIIKSKPRNSRRPAARRGGRAKVLETKQAAAAKALQRQTKATATTGTGTTTGAATEKIIVSNLPLDVNETQIKELFSTTIGPLRDVTLHYDAKGNSKGTATVLFAKKGDGQKAHQQYNNRLIDGKRPMKIEMIMGPPTLASRVAPAATVEGADKNVAKRGAGRPRRGRRGGKSGRPTKSATELDTEMEDWQKSETAPAAVAAA